LTAAPNGEIISISKYMPTRYAGDAQETRALNALIVLMRASDAFLMALQRDVAARRLTLSQFGVLEALLHVGPLCQGELAVKLLRSGASVTAVVDGLEKRSLVARQRSEPDRRFVRVALTAKGRRLIEATFPGHARTVARLFRVLTDGEQDELRRLCRKLGTSIAQGSEV
jgi:MarR family transcriptional regulator, 2-MHQ and catechol-resistance regulon repressor